MSPLLFCRRCSAIYSIPIHMRVSGLFLLLCLPFLVESYKAQYGPYTADCMSLIYRGVYMFDKKDSPRVRKNGKSEISLDIKVKPANGTGQLLGTVETLITSEDVFKSIGYTDANGKRIACCNEDAYKRNQCKNQNRLIIPESAMGNYTLDTTELTGQEGTIKVKFSPKKTGIYYVLTAVCDYHISPMVIEGKMVVENPYGHLPAPEYGSLPFFSFMCIAYVVSLLVWGMLCYRYSKEIMSVQIIIIAVLVSFVIDYAVKVLYLSVFNNTGNNVFLLSLLSIFLDSATRTLTRILTLIVCMGLGVCRAALGTETCKFVCFGVCYFLVSFWDAFCTTYPTTNKTMEIIRLFVTSGLDALAYFWIFQSLMDTMEELAEKKQVAKLEIFSKLRTLLVVSVVLATATLIGFSYIVVYDYARTVWKYQWLINEAIWSIYYFLLFFCIMVMWKPSENTAAYAYHLQVATDAEANDEEYGLPNETLVASEDEGAVVVNTISNDMKPMNMTETQM